GDSVVPVERREQRCGDGLVYRIPERKRLELDTAKNHIVHFFVGGGLVAFSLLSPPGLPVSVSAVRERVQSLSRLFKHEFRFRADATFETIWTDTLAAMVRDQEVTRNGDMLEL